MHSSIGYNWNSKKAYGDRDRRAAESAQQMGKDGMVNGWISKRMQLQLTSVTGAAYSVN